MNVTRIEVVRHRDTIEALRDLLMRAESGGIRAIAFSVKTRSKRHLIGFTGDYSHDPHEVLGIVTRMEYKLNQLISTIGDDPETEAMPL